jgi:hypothetical protein
MVNIATDAAKIYFILRRFIMTKVIEEKVKQPNEFEFTRDRGVAKIHYGEIETNVIAEDDGLHIEQVDRFFNKKTVSTGVIGYSTIESIKVKMHIALGYLLSGLAAGILVMMSSEDFFIGIGVIIVMTWLSYGKEIILTRQDISKVFIPANGGLFKSDKQEINRLVAMLNEKTGKKLL